jgi:hypothetical protein
MPQNSALARRLALSDFRQDILEFLQDVALGRRNATLEEVIEAKKDLDTLVPDADAEGQHG